MTTMDEMRQHAGLDPVPGRRDRRGGESDLTDTLTIERVRNGFVVTERDYNSAELGERWIAGSVGALTQVIADIFEPPKKAEPPKDPAYRPEPDVLELTTDMEVKPKVVIVEPGHFLGPGTPGHKVDDDKPVKVVTIEGRAESYLNPSGSPFMAGARATLAKESL